MTIPEPVKEGLLKFLALDNKGASTLLSALRSEHPALLENKLVDAVASQMPGLESSTLGEIVRSLLSVSSYRQNFNQTIDETVRDVMSSEGITIAKKDRSLFIQRLTEFLGVDALCITSKALDVLTNHQKILLGAQILTDLRPIFLDNPTDAPAAAVIVHTLKLTFRQGRERSDFFVALDTDDLVELRKVLDRAEKKVVSLKKVMKKAKLPHLEVNYES